MRQWILAVGVAACAAVGVAVAQQAAPAAPATPAAQSQSVDAQGMPAGTGRDIVERSCQACHGLDNIQNNKGTKDDWTQTVNQMVSRGADLSDKEIPVVIDYLAKNFAPAPTAGAAAPAKQ